VDRLPFTARFYGVATFAFLLFILYGSFVPWQFRNTPLEQGLETYRAAMTKPISYDSKSDFLANVMLFIPLGYLALGAFAVDRKPPLVAVLLLPAYALLSAGIEFGQVWADARYPSVNDVVGETIGGIIGSVVWLVAGQPINNRLRSAWMGMGPGEWAVKLIPPYVILIILLQGMPFDLTISPTKLKEKYQVGLLAVAPKVDTELLEKLLRLVVYFWPGGVLAANLPSREWRNSAGRVFGLGILLALAVEGVQLLVVSCGTYASDVILAALIVLASWAKTRWLNLESKQVRAGFLVLWIGVLAVASWLPFDGTPALWKERLHEMKLVPYADYYEGDYLRSFDRILQKVILFIPIGFFVGRVRYGILVGAFVGVGIELGQAFLSAKHPVSVSDVCNGIVGGVIGSLLTRQFLDNSRLAQQGFRYNTPATIPEAMPVQYAPISEAIPVVTTPLPAPVAPPAPVPVAPVVASPPPPASKPPASKPPTSVPVVFPPGASPFPPGASPYPSFLPPPKEE